MLVYLNTSKFFVMPSIKVLQILLIRLSDENLNSFGYRLMTKTVCFLAREASLRVSSP